MSGLLSQAFTWRALRALLRPSSYARGKALQERADFMRLYLLTGAREAWPDAPRVEDVDELPALPELRAKVRERLGMQALTVLDAWHRERPAPLPPESPRAPVEEAKRAALEAERAEAMVAAQRRAFGFELRVAPSSAGAGSGSGVWLTGAAPPGSILAFYPGVTYEVHDVIGLPGGTRFFDKNDYLMARYDRAIVDASTRALELLPGDARANPLSVAHRVNHPPRGSAPNVVPAPVQWDKATPAALLELLPNVSYEGSSQKQRALLAGGSTTDEPSRDPRARRWDLADVFRASIADGIKPAVDDDAGPVLKGLALVASREVRDEELFLNYRLNPGNKYPEWYVPVDAEEDSRRWSR